MILTRQERITEALPHFRIAEKAHPEDPEILAGLGWTFQKLNHHEKAIRYYQQAVRLDPSNLQAQQALGELWDITRKYDRAIEAYETAIKLNPESPDNYFHLGRLYDHLKQGEKAVWSMALAEPLFRKRHDPEMAAHCRKNVTILARKYRLSSQKVRQLTQSMAGEKGRT
ncbi:MAG: tetratricopeptide repeat protein [Nitrospinaceae bacterium]|nr:tetratricopeptide repeat protein [Nitrospinaceae bacterium]NIR54586.1 tetratricopeptide repeat protein [Nitrospinaceae bacterium]NIS85008.1 tetratricopeptide repeat protein [Nitrospinaceae bacterium]NIT81819.1 tetratricopeptide repeat protein [Nitrospinaceae bacterium]NIU44082.1 tetratricopeptide repeat protein [Nitrospinaceae bacterium]